MTDVTRLLADWGRGDQDALERLTPVIYDKLHGLAIHYMRGERSDHTLQATALVNEAYERLVDVHSVTWRNRNHFYAVAATAMRRILVDHARRGQARKREGRKLRLHDITLADTTREPEIIALDDALNDLHKLDERQSRIIELRFFGGLSIDETGGAMGLSTSTVKREWRVARAWLFRQLAEPASADQR